MLRPGRFTAHVAAPASPAPSSCSSAPPSADPLPPVQGTKACLGWDRVAAALTTGTSAITDLWLQLLLATSQVAAAVKAHLAARAVAAEGADGGAQVGWSGAASLSHPTFSRAHARLGVHATPSARGLSLAVAGEARPVECCRLPHSPRSAGG